VPPLAGICLLNNCKNDKECEGCTADRNTCKVDEGRCIACDPTTQTGCKEGETCTGFGICAPISKTCATDDKGNPVITCTKNEDCLACSPKHQVCDLTDGACKACTETNTSHCLQSEICDEGRCAPKCPKACLVDNDCGFCGSDDKPAHACFNHKCAQCSDTYPCPAGEFCEEGVCVKPCGIYDSPGACQTDDDCKWCGAGAEGTGTADPWTCKFPINGATFGKCAPEATGCSDIGAGVAVLPEPWSKATNLCSDETDCSGVGIEYNVGKLVKDLVGGDTIDVGFAEIQIQDANVFYGMSSCASVDIIQNISCGVCVPCQVDADCAPIPVDQLVFDLFKGEALAQIAGALLLDLLYGSENEKNLNFFCQNVAAGYGVCIPCGNPLQPCGKSEPPPPGGGSCDHTVCETGGPLDPGCSDCAKAVCTADAYCCTTAWDEQCKAEVKDNCATSCDGGGTSFCGHGPCETGAALSPLCSACTKIVCEEDPFCCSQSQGEWDDLCTERAATKAECDDQCDAGGGCAHSECTAGVALTSSCSACTAAICGADDFCCNTEWDSLCVDAANESPSCSCN
jgi:hypothetical protein